MDYSTYKDTTISGAGSVGGGTYKNITISGSGKVNGDVSCGSFDASGSAKVEGDLICGGAISTSGAFKVTGDVKCGEMDCAGAVKVMGSINAGSIDISGALAVGGDCSAETFAQRGGVKIEGLLNAEEIDICMQNAGGNCKIGQIGGGKVKITSKDTVGSKILVFFNAFSNASGMLETTLIEADRVELEHVKADTVRAIDAVIGDDCEIGTLEYSGEMPEISENAKVGSIVKI